MDSRDIFYMQEALLCAHKAFDQNEVPVGAVIVRNDEIIARGYNKRETEKNALLHAEIDAINQACKKLGGWRLWNCAIYVTLEPCPMCAGAIMNAHIPKVCFGAYDQKNGSCGSVADLFTLPYGFKPECIGGILETECSTLLKDFFKTLRNQNHPR